MQISLAVALRETQSMSDIYQQRLLIQAQAIADLQAQIADLQAEIEELRPAASQSLPPAPAD